MNVLWIMCDELRADAISAYGSPFPRISTPNIDRLAAVGALFERSFSASPVCVPARASIATGRRPDETGVWGNEAYEGHPTAPGLVAFTHVLADAGWTTQDFGKEHLPAALAPWQAQDPAGSSMVDLLQGMRDAGRSILRTPGMGFAVGGTWPDGVAFPPEQVTERAIAAMANRSGPFLVRASYLQPHTPVIVPEPWASRYADVDFPSSPSFASETSDFEERFAEINAGHAMDPDDFRAAQAAYHGAVAWLDDQVGRLLDAVERLGIAGDTVIVFTADHGAHLGEDGAYGKHTFAPTSHKVPLIVVDPRRTIPGTRRADLAHGTDVARTILGSCGVAAPSAIGGRDLLADPAPDYIVSSIGYGAAESRAFPNRGTGTGSHGGGWPQRFCIRTRRYRLDITTRVDGRPAGRDQQDVFLADTLVDPLERTNRAGDPALAAVRDHLVQLVMDVAAQAFQPDDRLVYEGFAPPAGVLGGAQ